MQTKIIEIRDRATYIPVLCVNMNPSGDPVIGPIERAYLREQGFSCDGEPNVLMTALRADGYATNDPYGWKTDARTYGNAHNYICDHWNDLKDGDVVDVEFILGETSEPKVAQRLTYYGYDE